MENKFSTKQEVMSWLEGQAEEDVVFFGNVSWNFLHRPLSNESDKIKELRAECQQLLAQNEAERRNEYEKDLREKMLLKDREIFSKKSEIERLEKEIQSEKAKSDHLVREDQDFKTGITGKLQRITTTLDRQFGNNQSSPQKGATGEAWVKQLLIDDPTVNVNYVGSAPHQGDFAVSFNNSNIMAMTEVKNTLSTLPTAQKEKFLEDLDSNSQYHCGILISLHSNFGQNVEDFRIYRSNGERKPYCFLSNLADKQRPEIILKLALFALQVVASDIKATSGDEKIFAQLIMADLKAWESVQAQNKKCLKDANSTVKNLEVEKLQISKNLENLANKWELLQQGNLKSVDVEVTSEQPPSKIPKNNLLNYFNNI